MSIARAFMVESFPIYRQRTPVEEDAPPYRAMGCYLVPAVK